MECTENSCPKKQVCHQSFHGFKICEEECDVKDSKCGNGNYCENKICKKGINILIKKSELTCNMFCLLGSLSTRV